MVCRVHGDTTGRHEQLDERHSRRLLRPDVLFVAHEVERRRAFVVGGRGMGAGLEQRRGNVDQPVVARLMQWRVSVAVLSVYVAPECDQGVHGMRVVVRDCDEQRCVFRSAHEDTHMRPVLDQEAD